MAVGRDGRLSGPGLAAALMRGLVSTGLDVVDLGAVTTPMLYYVAATRGRHGCSSGIQVTGSHNPKDYNGFKMVMAGRAIYGDDIQKLRQRIEAEDYTRAPRPQPRAMDIGAEYAQRIVGDCRLARPMKIVVDSRQRHPRRQRAGHPARAGLRGHRPVQPRRRRLPQPPPRPEQAREPGRPDQGRARHRGRARPGLRRRRRPPGRGHARRQHHLPRPPDHAVRARHPAAPQGRADHLRRQVLAAPAGGDPRGRRRAAAVEDRALADQGQAARRPARPSPAR